MPWVMRSRRSPSDIRVSTAPMSDSWSDSIQPMGMAGEGKDRPEEREHDREKADPAEHGMEEDGVEAVGEIRAVERGTAGGEIGGLQSEGAARLPVALFPTDLGCGGERMTHRLFQLGEALAAVRLDRHDGHAEFLGELHRIEAKSRFLGHVDHVQRDDGGDAEFEDFEGELEMAFEIRGIDDADGEVGRGMAFVFP
jgi:hypothetical protein